MSALSAARRRAERTWATCGSWKWRRHAGIVEAVSFVTIDPAFFGEMTLTATFEEVAGGAEVTLMFNAGALNPR